MCRLYIFAALYEKVIMAITVLLVLVGFVLLYFGAELLIGGAEKLAFNFNISKAIVGVVLVAFGTSAPELFVNAICAIQGNTDFALSNVSGSNLTNLCIGFGLVAIIARCTFPLKAFSLDLGYFVLAPIIVVTIFMISYKTILPLWTAWVLLPLILIYLFIAATRMSSDGPKNAFDGLDAAKGFGLFLIGIIGLYFGGEFVVNNSVKIGEHFNLDASIIGLTIVAAGTSIPDVMASVVAARKGENEIAIGNLLGSNIFNIFMVLSATLLISGADLLATINIFNDYMTVLMLSLFFALYLVFRKRLDVFLGFFLLAAYGFYYYYRIAIIG